MGQQHQQTSEHFHHMKNPASSEDPRAPERRNATNGSNASGGGGSFKDGRAGAGTQKLEQSMSEKDKEVQIATSSAQEKPSPARLTGGAAQTARATPVLVLSPSPASSRTASPIPSPAAEPAATSPQSYASKEAFYTSVRESVKASHGVTIWRYNETAHYPIVVCGRKQATGCEWRMRVDWEGGGEDEKWVVNKEKSCLEHQHEEKSCETRLRGQRSRLAGDEEDPDASSSDCPDGKERISAHAGSSSLPAKRTSARVHPPPSHSSASPRVQPTPKPQSSMVHIPNAPKVGDRYADVAAALAYYESHVVPILGVRVSRTCNTLYQVSLAFNRRVGHGRPLCSYRIVLFPDEKRGCWRVDKSSNLHHNYGPVQQILKDPSWRPHSRNNWRERQRKRARRTVVSDSDDAESSSSEVEEEEDSPIVSRSIKPRPSAPAPRLSTASVLAVHRPSVAPTPICLPSSSSSSFLPTLSLFVTSLHPSLGALASTLHQGGLSDLSLLVRFIGMDGDLRDRVLLEMNVGLLQRRLVRKVLREAKEKGWEIGVREVHHQQDVQEW